jgi:hypothetical protein
MRFWFIMRLAAKAPRRRRPVSSTLGITLNNVRAIANGRTNEHAIAHLSGIGSTATQTAPTSCSRVRQQVACVYASKSHALRGIVRRQLKQRPFNRLVVPPPPGKPRLTALPPVAAESGDACIQPSCACTLSKIGRRTGSSLCAFHLRPAMPNPALNRSANGKAARPRGSACLSSASRPGSLAVVARLALR